MFMITQVNQPRLGHMQLVQLCYVHPHFNARTASTEYRISECQKSRSIRSIDLLKFGSRLLSAQLERATFRFASVILELGTHACISPQSAIPPHFPPSQIQKSTEADPEAGGMWLLRSCRSQSFQELNTSGQGAKYALMGDAELLGVGTASRHHFLALTVGWHDLIDR